MKGNLWAATGPAARATQLLLRLLDRVGADCVAVRTTPGHTTGEPCMFVTEFGSCYTQFRAVLGCVPDGSYV